MNKLEVFSEGIAGFAWGIVIGMFVVSVLSLTFITLGNLYWFNTRAYGNIAIIPILGCGVFGSFWHISRRTIR